MKLFFLLFAIILSCSKNSKKNQSESPPIIKTPPIKTPTIKNKSVHKPKSLLPIKKNKKPDKILKKTKTTTTIKNLCPSITLKNYVKLSTTPGGRLCLRNFFIDKSSRINSKARLFKKLGFHHLFRRKKIFINGHKRIFRKYKGRYYRKRGKSWDRISLNYGDKVSIFGPRDELGFSTDDIRLIRSFYAFRVGRLKDENVFNRTFSGRFADHELLLEGFIKNPNTPGLKKLHKFMFPNDKFKPVFIDIGPGIANIDLKNAKGKGIPAVTTIELANKFKKMTIAILDLPSEVRIFMGKRSGRTRSGTKFTISQNSRDILLKHKNIHIIAGNGLLSIRDQWNNAKTNPVKGRKRPPLGKYDSVIIRAANSIDIYCMFHKRNGPRSNFPSMRAVFLKIAKDFRSVPVLFLFNRAIILKKAGKIKWNIIGVVSHMGFNHNERTLTRNGEPPYKFNEYFSTLK